MGNFTWIDSIVLCGINVGLCKKEMLQVGVLFIKMSCSIIPPPGCSRGGMGVGVPRKVADPEVIKVTESLVPSINPLYLQTDPTLN